MDWTVSANTPGASVDRDASKTNKVFFKMTLLYPEGYHSQTWTRMAPLNCDSITYRNAWVSSSKWAGVTNWNLSDMRVKAPIARLISSVGISGLAKKRFPADTL